MKVFDYLVDRILEQGSMTAYCLALTTATTESMPIWARAVMILAASYKFLKIG